MQEVENDEEKLQNLQGTSARGKVSHITKADMS